MDIELSLVTGTLNRKESFFRLLKSIQERTHCSWELVVSDASDPPYYTNNLPHEVVVIPERPREGCVKGFNKAFSRARGKYIIYLNDDAEVMPGYSKAAIDFMEKHLDVGLGCLYYAEQILPYRLNEYKQMIYGNFGIISRELGEKIQFMDPVVRMYGNDNSITFRVLLAGYGVVGIPGARIWHHLVNDYWKNDNQKLREGDATALMNKYRDLIPKMLEVYNRFSHLQSRLTIED